MARLKKHNTRIRNVDRNISTRDMNVKKKVSVNKPIVDTSHSPAIQTKNRKLQNFFKKQRKKKNKILTSNKISFVSKYSDDQGFFIEDRDVSFLLNNYSNLLYNVKISDNCSFNPYIMTHECSMNINNIKKIVGKYNISKYDIVSLMDSDDSSKWYDSKNYDWLFYFAEIVIGGGQSVYLDITDCVSGCGDHGQGTHSDNEEWRRSCFKSCVETVQQQNA
jgi:hypothetical protein